MNRITRACVAIEWATIIALLIGMIAMTDRNAERRAISTKAATLKTERQAAHAAQD